MPERKSKIPPGYRIEVYYETNPWTGARYRRQRLARIIDIEEPPDVPDDPNLSIVDPIKAQRMQSAWDNATSKDGRPPIGGAQDD